MSRCDREMPHVALKYGDLKTEGDLLLSTVIARFGSRLRPGTILDGADTTSKALVSEVVRSRTIFHGAGAFRSPSNGSGVLIS